jgi:hypothetical protein
MKTILWIGLLFVTIGTISMPAFAIFQKYVPFWAVPMICGGVTLAAAASASIHLKKQRLNEKRLRCAEASTTKTGRTERGRGNE